MEEYAFALAPIIVFMALYLSFSRCKGHSWKGTAKAAGCFGCYCAVTVGSYLAIYGASCFVSVAPIASVTAGSAADVAGLKAGDRLVMNGELRDWGAIDPGNLDPSVSVMRFSVMRLVDGEFREIPIVLSRRYEERSFRPLGMTFPVEFHSIPLNSIPFVVANEFGVGAGSALVNWFGKPFGLPDRTLIVESDSSFGRYVAMTRLLALPLLVGAFVGMCLISTLRSVRPSWFKATEWEKSYLGVIEDEDAPIVVAADAREVPLGADAVHASSAIAIS